VLSNYHASIDLANENNSHSCVLGMIGHNKRVLEAGCASGHVSEVLHARGCSVVGVEIDQSVTGSAEQWLERLIIADFDDGTFAKELDGESFDAILFGDVLEHLKDPLATLRQSVEFLSASGVVVISVPNITHADVKIALMNGQFPYSDSGLLDRTHIHFFTKESLLELVKDAGLVPVEICRITAPVFSTEVGVQPGDVSDDVLAAIMSDLESETYQFVVKTVRDNGTRALDDMATQLVDLTDRLRDATRKNEALTTQLDALNAQFIHLTSLHDSDTRELEHMRGQINLVKRFLPMPLIRFVRGLLTSR